MSHMSGRSKKRVTIIVPAYNEAEGIGRVLDGVLAQRKNRGGDWEVLVINDGSTDGTRDILSGYGEAIRVLTHSSSRGYGASLKTGILAARSENVLFIDADGQHDPDDIPRLVAALDQYECVFTARRGNTGIPFVRRPGKWLLRLICVFLANRSIPDINCGFRACRRHIYMRMLELLPDGFSFSTTSLLYVMRSHFSFVFLPITGRDRVGSSSVRIIYDGVKTILLALRLIMLFDPMRAFGYPAVGLILMGVVYQLYIIFTLRLTIVGGSILSVLGGMLLFVLGLISDQIASLRKEQSSFNSLLWERLEGDEDSEDRTGE